METIALLVDLRLAEEMGIHSLNAESDSLEIVQAIFNRMIIGHHDSWWLTITENCWSLLAWWLSNIVGEKPVVQHMSLLAPVLRESLRMCDMINLWNPPYNVNNMVVTSNKVGDVEIKNHDLQNLEAQKPTILVN